MLRSAFVRRALALLLACANRVAAADRLLRSGDWGSDSDPRFLGQNLAGKVALLLGFGAIGKALLAPLQALGMEVRAFRRHPDATSSPPSYGPDGLHQALAEADPGCYYGEIDGKWRDEMVYWDTRIDCDVETGDGAFVPGRDYFRKQATAALTAMQPLIDAARAEGFAEGQASRPTIDERCKVFGEDMPVEFWPLGEGAWKVSVNRELGPSGYGATMEAALDAAILDDAMAKALEAKGATNES